VGGGGGGWASASEGGEILLGDRNWYEMEGKGRGGNPRPNKKKKKPRREKKKIFKRGLQPHKFRICTTRNNRSKDGGRSGRPKKLEFNYFLRILRKTGEESSEKKENMQGLFRKRGNAISDRKRKKIFQPEKTKGSELFERNKTLKFGEGQKKVTELF